MARVNEIFTIDNQKLLNVLENSKNDMDENDMDIRKALDILKKMISSDSKNDIKLDYEDVIRVLKDKTHSYIIKLEAKNHKDIESLMKKIIQDISIKQNMKEKIKSMLLSFRINPDFALPYLSNIIDIIVENTNEDTDVIFGTKNDENIHKDNIEVTAIISHTLIKRIPIRCKPRTML